MFNYISLIQRLQEERDSVVESFARSSLERRVGEADADAQNASRRDDVMRTSGQSANNYFKRITESSKLQDSSSLWDDLSER